jgi:penicillin-binding protein 2B
VELKKNRKITKRAVAMVIIFGFVIMIMFSRFMYIQASKEVQDVNLAELLETRWTETIPIHGERGNIVDRNGEKLAEEIPSYSIVAILDDRYESHVSEPKETAEALASVLGGSADYYESQFLRDSVQVELGATAKNLSYETRENIEALELPGITFREDPRRYYPNQTFASHIIGYTERDMSEARMGLESSLNNYLQGESGYIEYQQDGKGRPLSQAQEIISSPDHGDNVVLTLDSRIQMAMEQTMDQVDEMYEPEKMMAIAAHAETGEILAMSNRPSFNPNEYENVENYTNYNISSRFEPGSTMKMFTLAAAIEEGVYDGEDTFESGRYQVTDRTISDHNDGEGWGEITFNEGVQRSSNVAFSKIAIEILGPEKLYEYIDSFGFRTPTGIDLPNEISGGQIAETYTIDAATTAFGQATSISPMQQIHAALAIANDGKMMKPYVVSEIVDGTTGDVITKNEPEATGEPISAETAKEVRDILETVVSEEEGTGGIYGIEGYDIAGKTGTAQIPREEGGGYISGHGENIYSFIGMAPADDPQVVVYVAVERPDLEETEYGNRPVSMVFRQVMEQSMQYLNIAPHEEENTETVELGEDFVTPDFSGENREKVLDSLEEEGMEPVIIGEGRVIRAQSHEEGTLLAPEEKIILHASGEAYMPEVEGWSLRNVQQLASLIGAEVDYTGSGFAVSQEPLPGTSVDDIDNITIELGEPEEESQEEPEEPVQLPE